MNEIEFKKYKYKGEGYHWKQISKSIKHRNLFVLARYQLVVNLLKDEIRNKRVLDVGCGDGVLSYLLSKKGADVVGVDSSVEAIAYAQRKLKGIDNLKFVNGSAYELPFSENSFDYIVSSEVIEHLSEPDKMLLEMKRAWNKTGKIIITTPVRFTEKPLDQMHFQEFFEKDFLDLINGFYLDCDVRIVKSHPLFWTELQNKLLFGKPIYKGMLNLLNILFCFNPYKINKGWKYYCVQTIIIKSS